MMIQAVAETVVCNMWDIHDGITNVTHIASTFSIEVADNGKLVFLPLISWYSG